MRIAGMKVKRLLQIGVILFVGINCLLIYLDNDGKVDRIAYINDWTLSDRADLKEEILKPAVLIPESEMPIYFTENQGIFQEFLVAEGDEITVGEDLFTYQVENYYEAEAELLSEAERISESITATEQAIREVERVTFTENEFVPPVVEEFSITVEVPASSMEAEFMKRQYLAEKEKEVGQLEAALDAVNSQLDSLQSTGDTITYSSPYDGRVQNISQELDAPLIVIESFDLNVEALLTEDERVIVEETMPSEMWVHAVGETYTASIVELADTPENIRIQGESNYPLIAALNNEDIEVEEIEIEEETEIDEEVEIEEEQTETDEGVEIEEEAEAEVQAEESDIQTLLPGYHGTLSITLDESLGATVIDRSDLIQGAIWKMNTEGLLEMQIVEIGLEEAGQLEVIDHLVPDELLAKAPESQLRHLASFITPLKWTALDIDAINGEETRRKKSLLSGLISR